MHKRNDTEIIQQYLKGNKRSLEYLIKRYLKRVHAFVCKNVGNSADAEDVTQEVFVKVWKNINKFDQKKDFKIWIFEIAKNASIDFLRKRKTIPFSMFEDDKGQNALTEKITARSAKITDTLDNKKTLKVAMQSLHSDDRAIIHLKHSQDLNFREIAESLKISINTVKSRYRRALLKARKMTQLQRHLL